MKKNRHILACSMVAVLLLLPLTAIAGPAEDFEEAQLLYLTTAASFAAYSGGDGDIARGAMKRIGWQIVPDIQKDEPGPSKFFFARKETPSSQVEYLLAIAGTSTYKDVELDFNVGKVFFAGKTFAEFAENAKKKPEFPDKSPMVHKGFNQYVQTAFGEDTATPANEKPGRKIVQMLLAQPGRVVYLAGHSAGGAAATLLGARLISMGVKPEQLKIVTLGAPAVGNATFAEKFSSDLNVLRVVVAGDPIPDLLKIFVRGYRQFGREILWKTSGYTFDEKHYPNIYMDCAIKNYYDKRAAAAATGVTSAVVLNEKPPIDGKRLYIAEIKNVLPKGMIGEFSYMREVLLDQYRDTIPAYVIGENDPNAALNFEALRAKAAEAECDRMVMVNILGSKQDDPATFGGGLMTKPAEAYDLIMIEQTVFRVSDGVLLDGRTYQNGSKYFTPVGALASAAVRVTSESALWSGQ